MLNIDGETLRQHLKRSQLSVSEILDIGIQMASALAAAHAAGIVHRDIKPENVMLQRDGLVKVLDFGLVKLTEPQSTTDTEAPTKALVHTDAGTVVGTANYAVSVIIYFSYFSGLTNATIDSRAVLPFTNQSGDENADYLSDGIPETIIYSLSQLPG